MAGSNINYQIRPNKAVERHLFIDLLSRINRAFSISDYVYIGLGGAYFEDFKLIHNQFEIKRMISIELDKNVFARQKFNSPYKHINMHNISSGDFIQTHLPMKRPVLFWLDYAKANNYYEQLTEFSNLMIKCKTNDIIKITLNANPNSIFDASNGVLNPETNSPYTKVEIGEKRLAKLKSKVYDFVPNSATGNDMTLNTLPSLLSKMINIAANKGISNRPDNGLVQFEPLTCFHYSDSAHQMITLTGALINQNFREAFLKKTRLNTWHHSTLTWGISNKIDIPAFTIKEKAYLDQHLPCKNKSIDNVIKSLNFKITTDDEANKEYISQYIKYQRYYPNYHQIIY